MDPRVKPFADLRRADLHRADLRHANLSDADLFGTDLFGADLRGAILRRADLSGADLSDADLFGTDLFGADLRGAILRGAILRGADLRHANLSDADLSDADLSDANLSGANLRRAMNIPPLTVARTLIVPPDGDVVGWKKCRDSVIVQLSIPHGVPRHNATGRKCRAERALVVAIHGAEVGISLHDDKTTYRVGETVIAPNYVPNRWLECAGGVHFYITREEAEAHG